MRDFQIRQALHANYLYHFIEDGESIVVDELPVCAGRTIADMAVVNGSLHAYEIKGTFDTLQRLEGQLFNYCKVFDYITVVTTENHLDGVMRLAAPNCGIWLMTENDGIIIKTEIRKADRNLLVDSFSLAQLLWKEEAINVLQKHGIAKGFKTKRKWLIWEKLSHSFSVEELSCEIRKTLKSRTDWKLKSSKTIGVVDQTLW